jgi:DNA-binding NarL/FixJ family response regulator
MSVRMRDWFVIPVGLGGFAGLAAKTGRPRTAIRLAAAAEAFAEAHDFASPRARTVLVQRWLEPVRRSLGPAVARLWAEGRRMTLEEAVACALANEPEGEWRPGPRHDLTRREREVAALVAQGLTNREVAQRLQLSVRTVEVHVDHILGKLEFRTRTQLGAWAYEEGLLAKDR